MGLFTNAGVGQANAAYNQANQTSQMLGGQAGAIGSNLTPFLTEEMLHPQGYGQQGLSAMTAAATGGAGGALAGFQGRMAQQASADRNAGSFQAGMDAANRRAEQAAAGAGAGIAAQNANLQQSQLQSGARGLQGLYNTDTSGMLNAMSQENRDIMAGVRASQAGPSWMSGLGGMMGLANGAAKLGSGFMLPGFSGFRG